MTRKRKTKRNKKQTTIEKSNGSSWSRRGWMIAVGLGLVVAAYLLGKRQDPVPTRPDRAVSRPAPLPSAAREETVPPFHEDPSTARPFPETLSPSLFDMPAVARAYRAAEEIPDVLAQQPCYCYCDGHGHRSLLDCYESYHAAG